MLACVLVSCIAFGGFGWFMHRTAYTAGFNSGYGSGYSEAKNEKAAAAWANTPEGKIAYRMAKKGDIGRLARCERPGWSIENGVCYVKPADDGSTYGWWVP
jgi:hypothetical protein